MALRTIPIHRAGNRPNLFMGGDRELVMFSGLVSGALVFSAQEWKATIFGILLWVVALYLFRLMAKSDPHIAANMTILLCSAWILLYAGIFFLGFGGSRWTSDIAINYYKSVLSVAMSLMAMILMIGIAQSIITTYYNQMSVGIRVTEILTIMVVAVILLLLVHRIPGLIAGILSGSSIGSSSIGSYGAGTAMGVAGVAAVTAGAAIATVSKYWKSDNQTVQDALQNTQQNAANHNSAFTNASGQGGLAEAMGSNQSATSSTSKNGASPLRQSAEKMKERVTATMDDGFDRAADTQSAMSSKSSDAQSSTITMPNTITAATNQDHMHEEIAAFVYKNA